jgi:phage-related minor tail protein
MKLQVEIRERMQMGEILKDMYQQAEQASARIGDDALGEIEEFSKRIHLIEKNLTQSKKHQNEGKSKQEIDQEAVKTIETRIQNKMAESVEELAQIIKDYAKRHKKLSDKVQSLELKVIGSLASVKKDSSRT